MRQATVLTVLVVGLATAVALLVVPSLFGAPAAPTATWDTKDEIAVAPAEAVDPAEAALGPADQAREMLLAGEDDEGLGERTQVLLRGRVVDRFHQPVREARIWLDFGRGGGPGLARGAQQRRVPEPVQSDAEGRFAFQGQTFRNLRIMLTVAHRAHAPSHFERNLGEVQAEMDIGELVVADGGELTGRVTDLDGNGIPAAEVRLQPENETRFRFGREQDLLAPLAADNNGYYRASHVAAGEWRVAATAPHHQNGSSETTAVAEAQVVEIADIRLGPGYELAGVVSDAAGAPIAEAEVVARPRSEPGNANTEGDRRGGRGGGGRGGPGGAGGIRGVAPMPFGGGDHRTRTDAQGRFGLDHLPGTSLEVSVRKDSYLTFRKNDVDAKTGQTMYVTLQDGLVITGTVTDAVTGSPVPNFAVRAERLRSLDGGENGVVTANWGDAMRQMRDGAINEEGLRAMRTRVEARVEDVRRQAGDFAQQLVGDQRGRGRERRFPEHAGGPFRETGLQEGVYAVVVEAPTHATWRSQEIELRLGATAPDVAVALLKGLAVRGVIHDADGKPIANADVELRSAEQAEGATASAATSGAPGGGRGGRGARGGRGGPELRQLLNGFAGAVVTTTTDRAGQFALEHAMPGRYRVSATAKGHDDGHTEPFALASDMVGIDLVLGALGRLGGHVVGATKEQLADARVVAVPAGDAPNFGAMFRGNNRMFATVHADGTYGFDELAPGAYAVRAFVGNGMRELFVQFSNGEMLPDVTVRPGEAAKFDVALTVSQAGPVRGSVLHNGAPAVGFRVALRRADDTGSAPGGGGRRGGFGFNREFNATVDGQGRFEIIDVPPGPYQLTVSTERRAGNLYNQNLDVHAIVGTEVTITVTTSAIEGQVAIDDGTPPADLDGVIVLLAGATEIPQDPRAMRGGPGADNGAFRARVQDGRFSIDMLPPGSYLAVLNIRGRERTSMQVVAAIGQRSSVTVPLGKKSVPAEGGSANGTPTGGNRRGG